RTATLSLHDALPIYEQCRPPIVSPPGEPNPEDAIGPGEARLVATALARKGDTSLLCKCNDFNTYGIFDRDSCFSDLASTAEEASHRSEEHTSELQSRGH